VLDNLNVAIEVTKKFQEREVIVSERVLLEVIEKLIESGNGQVLLNVEHGSGKYPFIHKAIWRGITFMHLSQAAFGEVQQYRS
jgi:hypothetical protein